VGETIGFDHKLDWPNYAWFMAVALTAPLPQHWERESTPDGEVVYYNSETDSVSFSHPLHLFLRNTFARVVRSRMNADHEKVVKNMITDKLTQQSLLTAKGE